MTSFAKVGGYVLGNLTVSVLAGVLTLIWLLIFGVPLLRARSDLEPEDVEHLEELIGSAVRRFSADRAKRVN